MTNILVSTLLLLLSILQGAPRRPLFPTSGGGTFSLIQKTANSSGVGTSPITLSLPSTAAGNLIVVSASAIVGSAGTISFSDGTNTYTTFGVCQNGSNLVRSAYVVSGVGGSLTISVSYSGTINATSLWANAREYHSTTPASIDQSACGSSFPSTSSPSTGSITTTGNGLIIGALYDFNASSGGCGTGWTTNCSTNTNQATAGPSMVEDKLNQTAGSYSAPFTLGAAESDYANIIFSFKD